MHEKKVCCCPKLRKKVLEWRRSTAERQTNPFLSRSRTRWRKLYLVNGHRYQAKRFARTALCSVCHDRIWGLGRQGYKCLGCKVMVHKRCHKFILSQCPAAAGAASHSLHSHLAHSHSMINPLVDTSAPVITSQLSADANLKGLT